MYLLQLTAKTSYGKPNPEMRLQTQSKRGFDIDEDSGMDKDRMREAMTISQTLTTSTLFDRSMFAE